MDQFYKNFQKSLVGSGHNGIGPFNALFTQGAILTWLETNPAVHRLQFDYHQIFGNVLSGHQPGLGQVVSTVAGAGFHSFTDCC